METQSLYENSKLEVQRNAEGVRGLGRKILDKLMTRSEDEQPSTHPFTGYEGYYVGPVGAAWNRTEGEPELSWEDCLRALAAIDSVYPEEQKTDVSLA